MSRKAPSTLPLLKSKNRVKRTMLMLRLKQEMAKEKRERRERKRKEREVTGEAPPEPRTTESMRVPDETIVHSDNEEV